ncbi:MAG: hypothetical protein R3F59_29745 [Myxococcota bacterium]
MASQTSSGRELQIGAVVIAVGVAAVIFVIRKNIQFNGGDLDFGDLDWSVWGVPTVMLAAGLVAGAFVAANRRSDGAAVMAESRRIDLEATRDEVLEQLKQLELDREKMHPADYQREFELLKARGARALEALDNPESSGAAPASSVPPQGPNAGPGPGPQERRWRAQGWPPSGRARCTP